MALDDATTLFTTYIDALRDAGTANDVDTEVALDLATVYDAVSQDDDLNTAYWLYLGTRLT
jgi:hypothetical protein